MTNEADFGVQKCFGERPACATCVRKGDICEYDVEEGVTRQQDLRTRLDSIHKELAQIKGLIHSLQYDSDANAAELLARLRMGEDIGRLANAETRYSNKHACYLKA